MVVRIVDNWDTFDRKSDKGEKMMKGRKTVLAALATALVAVAGAQQELHTEEVRYEGAGASMEGFLARPQAAIGKLPVVIVVHDWNGIDEYERRRCRMLAELGYLAFAADVYGREVRPKTMQESAAASGALKGNRPLLRQRLDAALEAVGKMEHADPSRVAVIGYCSGGTAALEMARSGADIVGAVSFHGGLDSPTPADAANIRGKILVLHGADDPMVPPSEMEAFMKEMRDARVDWQLIAYGGAVHSFTEPRAGSDRTRGAAYDERADRRSWEHMRLFLNEVFAARG
jgi:dienelactone hydrolase